MSRLTDKSITEIIQELFETVQELELRYPGRKFTVDGHLLGSIGEVIAAEHYGLTLLKTHLRLTMPWTIKIGIFKLRQRKSSAFLFLPNPTI